MIEILNPGWHTSIQDQGRMGLQEFGIPYSGAMDMNSFNWANKLLNNSLNAALLEMTIKGPKLKFHAETVIVFTGAQMDIKHNGNKASLYNPIFIKKNDLLECGACKEGCRTYMSVLGGLQTERILSSRSQCNYITKSGHINKKRILQIKKESFELNKGVSLKSPLPSYNIKEIEVFKGPEFDLLEPVAQLKIATQTFTISHLNNRMAYQLEEKIINKLPEIWTTSVLPGTVQLTPNGTLIVLMRDAQVTGGYPRILQLSNHAVNILAQKSTRDVLHFKIKSFD
jgi:biotin-dependent carboxylase-like uncharacterized protein